MSERMTNHDLLQSYLRERGYVAMLWHVDDVKDNYDVTNEEALEILEEAITVFDGYGAIYQTIDDICERDEIKEKEEA